MTRPATYEAYLSDHNPPAAGVGSQINIIAEDSPALVLRNVAAYYDDKRIDGKTEAWAAGMSRRLREAANDNRRS